MTPPNGLVVAAVIRRDGRYLICQRPAHKRYGTLWEFPGGKVHAGETLEQAARRELDEELGLPVSTVGKVQFSHVDPGSGFQIDFLEVVVSGDPETREHTDLAWVEAEALSLYSLAPSDAEFASTLIAESN